MEKHTCEYCGGSGEVDSGGFTPWGSPINVPCVCTERLKKMADREDECESISAGGLAADLGMLNEERHNVSVHPAAWVDLLSKNRHPARLRCNTWLSGVFMAAYDRQPLKLTKRFKDALKELCLAEMEMMQKHEPDLADCWTWCEVEVGDLASCKGLSFQFGGEDDKPKGMRGQVRIVEPEAASR